MARGPRVPVQYTVHATGAGVRNGQWKSGQETFLPAEWAPGTSWEGGPKGAGKHAILLIAHSASRNWRHAACICWLCFTLFDTNQVPSAPTGKEGRKLNNDCGHARPRDTDTQTMCSRMHRFWAAGALNRASTGQREHREPGSSSRWRGGFEVVAASNGSNN